MIEINCENELNTISGGVAFAIAPVGKWAFGAITGGLFYDGARATFREATRPSGARSSGGQMNRDRRLRQEN